MKCTFFPHIAAYLVISATMSYIESNATLDKLPPATQDAKKNRHTFKVRSSKASDQPRRMHIIQHDVPTDTALILLNMAKNALNNAYCPYSQFPVGAALLCSNGKMYCGEWRTNCCFRKSINAGVNVENASYGGTICAERAAICTAVGSGE